jgi:hypothetical protein
MSGFKRLWTTIARYAKALEGIDNPIGDYILSLGKRVDKLERDVDHLESNCIRALAAAKDSRR